MSILFLSQLNKDWYKINTLKKTYRSVQAHNYNNTISGVKLDKEKIPCSREVICKPYNTVTMENTMEIILTLCWQIVIDWCVHTRNKGLNHTIFSSGSKQYRIHLVIGKTAYKHLFITSWACSCDLGVWLAFDHLIEY